MQIYLDLCCLNRPLDDQSQTRVRLESEAIGLILEQCGQGKHQWVSSEALEFEAARNPDEEQRRRVLAILQHAAERIQVDNRVLDLARGSRGSVASIRCTWRLLRWQGATCC
jgi:hypothetical protein